MLKSYAPNDLLMEGDVLSLVPVSDAQAREGEGDGRKGAREGGGRVMGEEERIGEKERKEERGGRERER